MSKPQSTLKEGGPLAGVDIDLNPDAALRQHVHFSEYGCGIVLRVSKRSAGKWLVYFETLEDCSAAVRSMTCIHCPASKRCKAGKSLHIYFSTAELQVGLASYESRIASMVKGWDEAESGEDP